MKPVDSNADLLRLGDRSGSDLSLALRELSARGPDATELASLATRLSLQGIAMTPPAATAPAPAVSPTRVAVQKLALAGTAVVAGVGLWWFLRAPTAPGSSEPAPARGAAAVTQAPPQASPVSAPLAPGAREHEHAAAPTLAAPVEPSANSASAPPSPSTATMPFETRPAAPLMPGAALAPLPVTDASPHNDRQAKVTPSSGPRSAANGAEAPVTDAGLPSELELLRGARLALKGSPAEALRLVEQHRASYPAGKLTQERELIAISALLALGRRTAALSRAASFERAFPTSPYRKQIGELLQ